MTGKGPNVGQRGAMAAKNLMWDLETKASKGSDVGRIGTIGSKDSDMVNVETRHSSTYRDEDFLVLGQFGVVIADEIRANLEQVETHKIVIQRQEDAVNCFLGRNAFLGRDGLASNERVQDRGISDDVDVLGLGVDLLEDWLHEMLHKNYIRSNGGQY